MTRTATCQCRAFRVVAEGEPDLIGICHCRACQRRTGAAFSVHAYFRKEAIRLEGDYRTYTRDARNGRTLSNNFCPQCGATVGWTMDMRPGHYGIAVGAFNDPDFPAPTFSVWEEAKHRWVTLPDGIEHFEQARPAATAAPTR